MPSYHKYDLRRWWARKWAQMLVWWWQGQNVRNPARRNQPGQAVKRAKAATTRRMPPSAGRPLPEGMLPAVRLHARRAVAALIGLIELGTAAFGVALWGAISRAIAAHQPIPAPELRDYQFFIAKMNLNHARRGLSPVADWLSEQEARRTPRPRRRIAEPKTEPEPQPEGERIHDLRPDDEWMKPGMR